MSDLLMIVPSRGRPKNVEDLLDAWFMTTDDGTDLIVAVDDDDPALPEYRRVLAPAFEVELPVDLVVGPRLRLGGTLNKVALEQAANYRAVGFLGDDHRPRTKNWDLRFMSVLDQMGTGMVYADDLFQRQNLPTAIAMTSDIVCSLGYMVPGGLVHLYADDAWAALGRSIGRLRYLPDVVIEHLHPSAGKAEMDASYEETNSQAQFDADRHRFEDWKRFSMDADVARLKELISHG